MTTDRHHLGHRDRLRDRFLNRGGNALHDYEVLELLLFQAIPRRDTKPIAKALIGRFGSYAGVLRAEPAELRKVDGVGKAAVVAKDERERGARAQLNLGHTFAHALEAALGYGSLLHGEAVAIGLVAACNLAVRIELASEDLQPRVEALLARFGLPTRFPAYDAAKFAAAMALDKKAASGSLRFVLPVAAGEVKLVPDVPAAAVAETLKELAA